MSNKKNNLGKLGHKNSDELGMLGIDQQLDSISGSFSNFTDSFSDGGENESLKSAVSDKSTMGMTAVWIVILFIVGMWGYKLNFDQFEQNEIIVGSAMALLLFGAIRPILLKQKFDLKIAILVTFMFTTWYFFTYLCVNYANKDRYKNLIYK
jgi:hypothetical protein